MTTELYRKNNLVTALRDNLQSKYMTKYHFTCGESDFEGVKENEAYMLKRRDPSQPKDITGFYFRKDLCVFPPQNEKALLNDISHFLQKNKNLENKIEKNEHSLKIKIGSKEYSIMTYIGRGSTDELGVYFMEVPNLAKLNLIHK